MSEIHGGLEKVYLIYKEVSVLACSTCYHAQRKIERNMYKCSSCERWVHAVGSLFDDYHFTLTCFECDQALKGGNNE